MIPTNFMCGICGILFDDKSQRVDHKILSAMNQTMVHRGPDDEGIYIKGACGIAMRRLSIIDIEGGHQPLSNRNGSIHAVCNGEIYNYEELKEDLESRGHIFKTRSDAEVIPHLYEEYGSDFISKLNGMFGLAVWDERKRRLILARDRMGQKPLYYTKQNGVLLFASELKAILKYPGIKKEIDPVSLSKYLAYEYIPAPRSIIKGINKLEPGHMLIWQNQDISLKQYWDIPTDRILSIGVEEASNTLKDLLKKSVKRHLISDVPLGIFLSGGIDSSTITYMATKLLPQNQVKTFSMAFGEKSFDESSYARRVANHFGTKHFENTCTPEDLLSLLPKVKHFLDEPIGDASIIPTYALSKFTREHVKVALGGDGGDELFAGYPTFEADKLVRFYQFIPKFMQRGLVEPLARTIPVSDADISLDFKIKQFVKGASIPNEAKHFIWMGSFSPEEQKKILVETIKEETFDDVFRHLNKTKKADPGNDLLYLYKKLYLSEDILVKVDRASMACSLEIRAPFLDHHVVEFVSRLPYKMKLNGFTMKYILKRAMKDLLPSGIANRPKKGFGIPIAKWIKGPLKEMTLDLLNPDRIKRGGIFDANEVSKLLKDHLDSKVDNRKKLWTLIIFELWQEKWA